MQQGIIFSLTMLIILYENARRLNCLRAEFLSIVGLN